MENNHHFWCFASLSGSFLVNAKFSILVIFCGVRKVFLIIFELLELLRTSELLNIDFKAYQKIQVFLTFLTSPDNFGLRFTPAFRKDLEPILCMRFYFELNSNKKLALAQTTFQNMANFEKSTPVSP